jgi:hypothetical protein
LTHASNAEASERERHRDATRVAATRRRRDSAAESTHAANADAAERVVHRSATLFAATRRRREVSA